MLMTSRQFLFQLRANLKHTQQRGAHGRIVFRRQTTPSAAAPNNSSGDKGNSSSSNPTSTMARSVLESAVPRFIASFTSTMISGVILGVAVYTFKEKELRDEEQARIEESNYNDLKLRIDGSIETLISNQLALTSTVNRLIREACNVDLVTLLQSKDNFLKYSPMIAIHLACQRDFGGVSTLYCGCWSDAWYTGGPLRRMLDVKIHTVRETTRTGCRNRIQTVSNLLYTVP